MLLAGIAEGQATIDPTGVLECALLLDHGRLLPLAIGEHAPYGVEQLRHFMVSHQHELGAAHVNCGRAFARWAGLQEHMVKHFANMQMCKMLEGLAPEKPHAQWFNVWPVLVLLRTCCPAEAVVERSIA